MFKKFISLLVIAEDKREREMGLRVVLSFTFVIQFKFSLSKSGFGI